MFDLQNVKLVNVTGTDLTKTNDSWTTTAIDTKGFAECKILVVLGDVPYDMTVLKVQESDSANSGFADVTGLIVGTSDTIAGETSAFPTAGADDGGVWVFDIDLRGRKRYLDVVATAGTGTGDPTELCCIAILGRPEAGVTTATAAGATEILRV